MRIPAAKHAVETGLKERAIYNSLDQHVKPEEVASLRELGVQSSVLMAFDPRNAWPEGRLNILRGYEGQTGLLEAAKQAGLQKTLVDTAVLDVPSIGLASKATQLVKEECGLPTGCGPSNAVSTWKRVKMEYVFPAYTTCLASSAVVVLMAYADFVLYGPIEYAETVFPACAMTDAIIAYAARRLGTRTKTKDHPLFKIF